MALQVKDLEDQSRFRQILKIPYDEMVQFVMDYLKRKSGLMVLFWSLCIIFLGLSVTIRIDINGFFPLKNIFLHSFLGFVIFPIVYIPFHELLHIIPYFLSGAKRIRVGMDIKQYMFYVTAHRYVATSGQFWVVALFPFILTSLVFLFLVLYLPGLWKWSLSVFIFVHTTMCAGDFALLNFYWINRKRKIYTWDDADEKAAYFYEEI